MTYHVAQGAFSLDANIAAPHVDLLMPSAPSAPAAQDPVPTVNWGTVTYGDVAAKTVPAAPSPVSVTTLYTPSTKTAMTLYSPSVKTAVKTLYSSSVLQPVTMPALPVTDVTQDGGKNRALLVGGLLVLAIIGGVVVWKGTKK